MRFVIAEPARLAVLAAADWYDAERDGLGSEFVAAVLDAARTISDTPRAWVEWPDVEPRTPPVRRFPMRRFSYAIGYQAHENHVLIVAVLHARRGPGALR